MELKIYIDCRELMQNQVIDENISRNIDLNNNPKLEYSTSEEL